MIRKFILAALLLCAPSVYAQGTISAMTAASALSGTELFECVQSGSKKCTAAQIKTFTSASPTLVTPNLGTPSAGVATNLTGTASGLTAGTVTTNANLTGDVTSSGNATTLATVNGNVGSFTNSSITVNGKGLITAASSGAAGATLGANTFTANQIVGSGTTTAVGVQYGYSGTSGFGGIWQSSATPGTNNGLFFESAGATSYLRGTTAVKLGVSSNFFNVTNGSGAGSILIGNSVTFGWTNGATADGTLDLFLSRPAAATLQQGAANAASPVAQTLQAQGSRSGTDTNVGGANYTHASGNGTGTGTLSQFIISTPVAVASGTGAQTITPTLTLGNGVFTIGSNVVTPASSGTRYLCISTAGVVTSSASACSGT